MEARSDIAQELKVELGRVARKIHAEALYEEKQRAADVVIELALLWNDGWRNCARAWRKP